MKYLISVDFSENSYDAFEEGECISTNFFIYFCNKKKIYYKKQITTPKTSVNTFKYLGIKAVNKEKDEIVVLSVVEHTKLWVGILECNAALVEKAKKVHT